jgi:hypothetical protein
MPRITAYTATPDNMRRYGGPGVFALDRTDGGDYSADAGDYFWQPDDRPLTDEAGRALILARRETRIVAASEQARRVLTAMGFGDKLEPSA